MAKDRIFTLDIGVGKIVLAEFSVKKNAPPMLLRYAARALDPLGADVAARTMLSLSGVVKELAAEIGVKGGTVSVLLPSSAVFPRFVKMPQLSGAKLVEMVRAEAEENLPFPIEEVVWDYQTIGETPEGELDTLIVAAKNENAEDAAACAEDAGFHLSFVDATPLALYNCASYNHPEATSSCTMLLDIGARATTLVILDGGKVFVRGINVGGNVVTNEIARGLSIPPEEAERLKKEIGFVALGGTYAAEDETADKVSKIIRNVITRLHSEVARSINFYRVQQGGAAPERLLITGGSSLMENIGSFFQEKLQMDVGYLNPFASVGVAPGLDNQEDLFLLAPCAGLAVRAASAARLTIDLTPPAVLDSQRFSRRIPYFAASVLCVVLAMLCWVLFARENRSVYDARSAEVKQALGVVGAADGKLTAEQRKNGEVDAKVAYLQAAARSRPGYLQVYQLIRKAMIKDAWVSEFKFSGGEDARYLELTVQGFKVELDKLHAGGKTAGEFLLGEILRADTLHAASENAAEAGTDEGTAGDVAPPPARAATAAGALFSHADSSIQSERVVDGDRIVSMNLRFKLAAKLGEIDLQNKLPTDWVAK